MSRVVRFDLVVSDTMGQNEVPNQFQSVNRLEISKGKKDSYHEM